MRRLSFILLAPTVVAIAVAFTPSWTAIAETRLAMAPQPEKEKCITVGDKRICMEEGAKKCIKVGGKRICLEGDDNEAGGAGDTTKTGNICEGDNECPPGYIDLETPNKYKACCEPEGGFPETTPNGGGGAGGGPGPAEKPDAPTPGQPAVGVPEDASSPAPTDADRVKCEVSQQKSFVGSGCLAGHDSIAFSESKKPEYVATCKGKSGIPLCGPVPSRGGQFECWCYF